MNKSWIFWQVAVPIIGPIALTAIFISLWATGAKGFTPDYETALANVSPWALTFYSITLIGSTLNVFWPKLKEHPGLGMALIVVALSVCVYASFIAVWRHDSSFVPGPGVYVVTVVLLLITVKLCYNCYTKVQGS